MCLELTSKIHGELPEAEWLIVVNFALSKGDNTTLWDSNNLDIVGQCTPGWERG